MAYIITTTVMAAMQGGHAKRKCVPGDLSGRGGRDGPCDGASDFSTFNSSVRRRARENEGATAAEGTVPNG
jgi:hypothetical protein